MKTILRQAYIARIEKYLDKDTIIILTGQRRVGKSSVLRLFRDKVASNESNNTIYIRRSMPLMASARIRT